MNKSPGLDAVLVPLKRAERALREKAQSDLTEWKARAEVAKLVESTWKEAVKAAVRDGEDPPKRPASANTGPEPVMPRLAVSDTTVEKLPDDPDRVVISWRPAPGAIGYQVEMAEGAALDDPEVSWTRVAETTASQMLLTVLYPDRTMVRVRGFGMAPGPWSSAAVGALVGLYWLYPEAPFWGADPDPYWRD